MGWRNVLSWCTECSNTQFTEGTIRHETLPILERKDFTYDGIKRKKSIVEKVLYQDRKAELPLLQSYVKLFQSKDPLVHLLHDRQEKLFKEFLSCYVKSEIVVGKSGRQLKELDLTTHAGQFLDVNDMFIGKAARNIVSKDRKSQDIVQFLQMALTSYKDTGVYLQHKLPLTNPFLRSSSALDPAAHGHSRSMKALKKLKTLVPCSLSVDEDEDFDLEVHRFHVDDTLPPYKEQRLDEWWGSILKEGKYPALSKVALAATTVFHGPMVESSFNIMGDVIDTKSPNTSTDLYSSIQTVKYHLKSRGKSAVDMFSRKDIHDVVDPKLCRNLSKASSCYRATLNQKRQVEEGRRTVLQLDSPKQPSIQQSKVTHMEASETSRNEHEKKQLKRARQRVLEELAAKRKKQV